MASGIEIKTEVLPELRKMWKALIGAGDGYWPSYDEYPVDLTKDDWRRFIEDARLNHPVKAYFPFHNPESSHTLHQCDEP